MRALLVLLLASSVAVTTDAFIFDIIEVPFQGLAAGFESLVAGYYNIFRNIVYVGLDIGIHVIGVVIDPFGIWIDDDSDHGHADSTFQQCLAVADILFVLDSSGSMSRDEFQEEILFARRVVRHFRIAKNEVRFGAISFSSGVDLVFDLSDSSSTPDVIRYLGGAPYRGGTTNTAGALNYIQTNGLFSDKKGGRKGASKIVIIITNGNSDCRSATRNAADSLKSEGVQIIAVGVGTLWGINNELYDIGSGSNNVYTADFFTNLNSIEKMVSLRTCQIPIEEGNVPVTNNGCEEGFEKNPNKKNACIDVNECTRGTSKCQQNCVNLPGSYRCTCNAKFVVDTNDPTKCKKAAVCNAPVDIVAVIDASGSIGPENFKSLLTFLAKVTLQFTFGTNGSQWGALLFGGEVTPLFNLNTYSVRADVSKALTSAPYQASRATFTHQGLEYVLNKNPFSPAEGGRAGVPHVVLVITDGVSSDIKRTISAGYRLQQRARVVAVGVTPQISIDELSNIASDDESITVISDWDYLDYAEQSLAQELCPEKIYN